MRKLAASLATTSLSVAVFAWASSVLGWFPFPAVVALQAAIPANLTMACFGVIASLISRRPNLLRYSLVVLGIWLSLIADIRLTTVPPSVSGTGIRIVATNMMLNNVEPDTAAEDVLDLDPEILVSVETPPQAMKAFTKAGLTLSASGQELARNVHVWTKHPATVQNPIVLNDRTLPVTRVDLPTGSIIIVGVHLMSPTTGSTITAWRHNWEALTPALDALSGPVVVIGDFNTSLMHQPLRQALHRFNDAASSSRISLLTPTWPAQPYRWWPHPLQILDIDHILLDDVAATSYSRHVIAGSDHLAVAAQIEPKSSNS